MNERAAIWLAAAAAVEAHRPCAFATVARKRGSLPMASDAKMLVTADGGRFGTVGGGCTEAEVTAQALATLETQQPAFATHTLNADAVGDLALSCGGTVELFLEPLLPSGDLARLCRAVGEAISHRQPATVWTALEWPDGPSKAAAIGSDRLIVGAGMRLLPPSREVPRGEEQAAPARRARRQTTAFVDRAAGAFVEPLLRAPRLTIFGAGHVGAALCDLAARAGFYVVVVDDRCEFANRERLPLAHEIVVQDFRTALDRLAFDEDDYVIAATRGHSFDAYIVERTAASRAGYVGMLGSRRKRAVIFRALAAAGVPQEALARVRSPIGVDIGADTPAEIAVSVVAELIRVRRLGQES
jgi:xanthine dehydrogenase accessory factor